MIEQSLTWKGCEFGLHVRTAFGPPPGPGPAPPPPTDKYVLAWPLLPPPPPSDCTCEFATEVRVEDGDAEVSL